MKQGIVHWVAVMLGVFGLLSLAVPQTTEAPVTTASPPQSLSPAQLDQLTASVALYSDPLLGAILTAATYPLEVVEAARWLEDPANAALTGDQLASALQQQPWDASVKSLMSFPDVLRTMNRNLQWTERLGDAFLAQQADVMDSVQRLRRRATAAGSLASTSQQTVSAEDQTIAIEPANPDVVYVPYYDPAVVYGPWPWVGYPPFYFGLAPGIVFGGALIGFGIGIGIGGPFWGWWGWDWHHHRLDAYPHGRAAPGRPWAHDPGHRGGVPYRDAGTAARYGGAAAGARRDFRGFPGAGANMPSPRPSRPSSVPRAAQPMTHTAPPAFQSFGHGPQVRGEAARGSLSRSSAPMRSAPARQSGGTRHP
jgi:hypothetical protein